VYAGRKKSLVFWGGGLWGLFLKKSSPYIRRKREKKEKKGLLKCHGKLGPPTSWPEEICYKRRDPRQITGEAKEGTLFPPLCLGSRSLFPGGEGGEGGGGGRKKGENPSLERVQKLSPVAKEAILQRTREEK